MHFVTSYLQEFNTIIPQVLSYS